MFEGLTFFYKLIQQSPLVKESSSLWDTVLNKIDKAPAFV